MILSQIFSQKSKDEKNLERRIDRAHLVHHLDGPHLVHVAAAEHRHRRVVVEKVVQLLRPQDERGHGLPAAHLLMRVGDDAVADQVHHAVHEHLRVHAQVAVAFERVADRVGDGANSELQRAPVLDELCDELADLLLGRAWLRRGDVPAEELYF